MPPSFLEKSNTFFINIRKSFYTGERESMPNSNLVNAKNNMKSRIRTRVSGSNPRDLGRLAKSARFVGLTDDAEVETDIDTEMAAAIPSASIDDLVEMSEGLKELRTGAADMGSVASADNLTEGANKFLNATSVQPALSVSGDLSYNGGVVSYTAPTASALQVVATVGDLPAGASAGDQAVVQSNNKLYIKTADGWYAVALINTAPTVSGNDATYTLATDQTPTVITLTATDPENDPVTFSYAVTSGDLNGTTVHQADNVFTITPHGVLPATFELTFSANDTVNVATTTPSSFTLEFTLDWSNVNISTPSATFGGDGSWGSHHTAIVTTDTLIIAAMREKRYDDGAYHMGQVVIYDMSYNVLSTLKGSDFGTPRNFGTHIAVSGNNLIITEYKRDINATNANDGTIHIFDISDPSNPTLRFSINRYHSMYNATIQSKISTSNRILAVAVDGDTLVIGDWGYMNHNSWNGQLTENFGSVSIVDISGANPVLLHHIEGAEGYGQKIPRFGKAVAVGNGYFAVAAPKDGVAAGGPLDQFGVIRIYDLSTYALLHTIDERVPPYLTGGSGTGDDNSNAMVIKGNTLVTANGTQTKDYSSDSGVISAYDLDTGNRRFMVFFDDLKEGIGYGPSWEDGGVVDLSDDEEKIIVVNNRHNWGSQEGAAFLLNASDGTNPQKITYGNYFGNTCAFAGSKIIIGAQENGVRQSYVYE